MSDADPLIVGGTPSRWTSRRTTICCLSLLLLGSLGLATALIVTYFLAAPGGLGPIVSLKLMALNTWGMPATFGAQDKTSRMQAIGELIQKQEYDIYLLEELWMRPDHAHIKRLLPPGYHMTEVMDLNNPHQMTICDGTIGPDGCSGLAIVSKHKFIEVSNI